MMEQGLMKRLTDRDCWNFPGHDCHRQRSRDVVVSAVVVSGTGTGTEKTWWVKKRGSEQLM